MKYVFILMSLYLPSLADSTQEPLPKLLEFNCGSQYGYPISVSVSHAEEGSFMPYVAQFTSWGKDEATGEIIPTQLYQMEGDTDIWSNEKEERRVIHFNEVNRPTHQLVLEKKTTLGETLEAARWVDFAEETTPVLLDCTVTKVEN